MKAVKEDNTTSGPKNVYDANKAYKWKPEDVFEITGNQFGSILNATRAFLNTPEAKNVLAIYEANKHIDAILQKNVESGVIEESL
jgi:hypothetical protein